MVLSRDSVQSYLVFFATALIATVAIVSVTAGCDTSESSLRTGSAPTADNDQRLEAVAQRLESELQTRFADFYSGISLDCEQNAITVYRLPNSALDAWVRAEALPASIDLRDTQFTLTQLEVFRDRVVADIGYWNDRGISIDGVAPKVDGSGVDVFTDNGSTEDERALSERYPDIPIEIHQRLVVIPTASPLPPMQASSPLPSKTIVR